jgi:hypothetical protein
MEQQFIRILPLYSKPVVGEPALEIPMPVALWKSADIICEDSGFDGHCDTGAGHYYSIAGDPVTFWCPRHWYESHCGPNAGQRLVDMTDEEYAREREEQKERFLKEWQLASERLRSAAGILRGCGLQEEAGSLWEAHGAIDSRIRHL